ncbi:hypothetical protein A6456_38445 [Paraburkholderia tropica]|nr:hypothetical protein A6456_38445 [Paraburkholderia tropica]
MDSSEAINRAATSFRAAGLRQHGAGWLASAIGIKRVIGGIERAPQAALDRPEKPAHIAFARGELNQLGAIGSVFGELQVMRAVHPVVSKCLTTGEGLRSAGTDHVAPAPLRTLDIPCTGSPGGIQQHRVHILKVVPWRMERNG